ncbi:MAG: hypothetical protein M3Z02_01965 [Actinomycetota bacterium]|nr:hypothetical protein [Actinomycetota bacterium]
MPLGDLAGTGALRDALDLTNTHLAGVLDELRFTNRRALEAIATELRQVNKELQEVRALLSAADGQGAPQR